MSDLARTRAFRRKSLSEWIAGPIVGLLALSWPKRLAFAGGLAAALAMIVALGGHLLDGWSLRLWGSGRLPASAAERAPLFTEAWIENDEAAMRRFVRPADAARLHSWIAATPIPAGLAGLAPSQRTLKTVSVRRDDSDGAVVEVHIAAAMGGAASPKSGADITERQTWACSGGNWFFSPSAPPSAIAQRADRPRPASPRSAPTAARPPAAPRPRAGDDLDCH